jgi:hypothetical protein
LPLEIMRTAFNTQMCLWSPELIHAGDASCVFSAGLTGGRRIFSGWELCSRDFLGSHFTIIWELLYLQRIFLISCWDVLVNRQLSAASSLPEVVPSSSWEIKPSEIVICKHPDGSDWEIGSGGFGKVRDRGCLRNCCPSSCC